jgi:SAM-dependent methyltransferase
MLQRVLVEYAGHASSLVELGCGYGANVFSLVELNRWPSIVGFDVSGSAIEAAREIAKHFGCEAGLEFHRLDLLDGAAPAFARLRGATAFSYYCFEQLKRATGAVIDNLIEAGVSRVVHIEPTPELWSALNPVDLVSRLHTWSQDYQDNLLATLRQCEHAGRVRLLEVHRLRYAPSVKHDPTLVCWEPASQ